MEEYNFVNNETFCMAPWVHFHSLTNNKVLPCCVSKYNFPYGSLNDSKLSEIWNCDKIKNLRLRMLNGEKSPQCSKCYFDEKIGIESTRKKFNTDFSHHLDIVKTTKNDGTVSKFNLVYLEFNFSNICNFECIMCGPLASSSLYEREVEMIGTEKVKELFGTFSNNANWDIMQQIETLYPIVEKIYFNGGEPLIMEEHYQILKRLDDLGRYDVKLRYSTNFSTLEYKGNSIIPLWEKFPNLSVNVSLDGLGKRGEYIRRGLSTKTFLKNVATYYKSNYWSNLRILCTVQILNSFHITDLQKKLYELGVIKNLDAFVIDILTEPENLKITLLPSKLKRKLIKRYKNHINEFLYPNDAFYSINQYESAIRLLEENPDDDLEIEKFQNKIYITDIIYKVKNSKEIFPELSEIWY
jgi:hypothetical protein